MGGIIDQWCWTGIHTRIIIDIVPVDTLLAFVHSTNVAKIGTGNAGEAIGICGNGAILQALVIVEQVVGRKGGIEALLADEDG